MTIDEDWSGVAAAVSGTMERKKEHSYIYGSTLLYRVGPPIGTKRPLVPVGGLTQD